MSELEKVLQGRRKITEEGSRSPKPPPSKKPQLPPKNIKPQVASKIKASLVKPPVTTKPKLHPPKQSATKTISKSTENLLSDSSPGVSALASVLQGTHRTARPEANGTVNTSSLPRTSKSSRLEKAQSVEIPKPRSASDGADRPLSTTLVPSDEFFDDSPRQRSSPVVTPKSSPLLLKRRAVSMSPSKSLDSPLASATHSPQEGSPLCSAVHTPHGDASRSREGSAEPDDLSKSEKASSLPRAIQLSPRPPELAQSMLGGNLATQSQNVKAKSSSDLSRVGVSEDHRPPPPARSMKPPVRNKPQFPPKPSASKLPKKPLVKEPRVDKDIQPSEKKVTNLKNISSSSFTSSEDSECASKGVSKPTASSSSIGDTSNPRKLPPTPPAPYKKSNSPPTPPAPYRGRFSPQPSVTTLSEAPPTQKTTEIRKTPPTPPPPYSKTPSPPTPKSTRVIEKWPPQGNSPPGRDSPIKKEDSVTSPRVKALSEMFSSEGPAIRVTASSVTESSAGLKQKRIAAKEKTDSGFGSEVSDDVSLPRGMSLDSLPSEDKGAPPLSPTMEAPEEWDEKRLEKARSKRHNIAQELLSTEKTYVERIKCIAVDFYDQVAEFNVKYRQAIPPVAVQQIFLNIQQIHQLNERILQELQQRMDTWETHEGLGDVLARLAPFLKLYSLYTSGFEDAMKTLTDWTKRDKRFDTLIREFERNTLTMGLGVAHYMLEPVQRIPRYRLLLADYLKYLPPNSPDRPDTTKALDIISEAADRTNDRIKELENSNEILAIHRSLTDYVGSLVSPSRVFIKKGELQKFSRKSETPRMFFLFSDILLHTKPSGNGTYEFRNEMPIFGMTIEDPKVSLVSHSFNVHSTTRALILVASSEEEKQEWMGALSKVINDDMKKRQSLRRDVKLQQESSTDGFGTKAPIMVPDKSVTMCQTCSAAFSFTFRRHHCRACGKVVCGNCSQWKAHLPYMDKTERVCEICYGLSKGSTEHHDGTDSLSASKKQESISSGVLDLKALEDDAVIAAYVLSQDGRAWKKQWYQVKRDFVLYKFRAHEDIKAVHSMPLPGYIVSPDRGNSVINLIHPSSKKDLSDTFKVEDAAAYERWLLVLSKVVNMEIPEEAILSPTSNRSSLFEDSIDFSSRPSSVLNNGPEDVTSRGSRPGSISKESGSLSPVSS